MAYIEREAAIKALMNDAPEQVGYSREDAADCIRYMDAVDVAPVRQGGGLILILNLPNAHCANILFMRHGMQRTTAPTVVQRWIWGTDNNEPDDAMVCTKKMMDIGGMETIFVAMGG